ncbi:MAG TPA: PilZ domain-containing protein [Thermoanaerobaculia bacterium]|jgi:Tfp pilus assembly protein PilZ
MERREDLRRPYRIQVFFWERGSDKRAAGYTVNVSSTGMLITTSRPLPRGRRIRVEMRSGDGPSVMTEAVVARAQRSVHQLHPDTMGVRFLSARELVAELIPEVGSATAEERTSADDGVYLLRFPDRRQFLATFQRDLSTGGLFVPTDNPAPLDTVVAVELRVAAAAPLRFQARVVHRLEPSGGNLMAGMGLELLGFEQTLAALKALAASLEQGT